MDNPPKLMAEIIRRLERSLQVARDLVDAAPMKASRESINQDIGEFHVLNAELIAELNSLVITAEHPEMEHSAVGRILNDVVQKCFSFLDAEMLKAPWNSDFSHAIRSIETHLDDALDDLRSEVDDK